MPLITSREGDRAIAILSHIASTSPSMRRSPSAANSAAPPKKPVLITSCPLPLFSPRPQDDLESPRRPVLPMEVQVGLRNVCWIRHVIVHRGASQTMPPGAILLGPPNRRINRHVCHMDALWHEFSRHTLRQARLPVTGH